MAQRDPSPRDPFLEFDAPYVFGALSSQDRSDYEAHLPTCADCRRAVAELAGLPGLLARVSVEQVVDSSVEDPPRSLLPRLLTEAARERRRLRLRATVGAALVAACLMSVIVLALRMDGGDDRTTGSGGPSSSGSTAAPAAVQLPMRVVADTSLRATVAVQAVAWGTKVEMRCTYPAAGSSTGYEENDYALRAVLRDGSAKLLATWNAVAGRTLRIEGDSSSDRADISAVQVTDRHGEVLLETPV